jgi:hypothetical protein
VILELALALLVTELILVGDGFVAVPTMPVLPDALYQTLT